MEVASHRAPYLNLTFGTPHLLSASRARSKGSLRIAGDLHDIPEARVGSPQPELDINSSSNLCLKKVHVMHDAESDHTLNILMTT
jgi:hypothetical protein